MRLKAMMSSANKDPWLDDHQGLLNLPRTDTGLKIMEQYVYVEECTTSIYVPQEQ